MHERELKDVAGKSEKKKQESDEKEARNQGSHADDDPCIDELSGRTPPLKALCVTLLFDKIIPLMHTSSNEVTR